MSFQSQKFIFNSYYTIFVCQWYFDVGPQLTLEISYAGSETFTLSKNHVFYYF